MKYIIGLALAFSFSNIHEITEYDLKNSILQVQTKDTLCYYSGEIVYYKYKTKYYKICEAL